MKKRLDSDFGKKKSLFLDNECFERCYICTGTVYWGVMLPPSMLSAKRAAVFLLSIFFFFLLTARLVKTCSKGSKDQH